jgi:hypothetical protein
VLAAAVILWRQMEHVGGYIDVYVKCLWFYFDGLLGEIFTFVGLPFIYLEAMKLFL